MLSIIFIEKAQLLPVIVPVCVFDVVAFFALLFFLFFIFYFFYFFYGCVDFGGSEWRDLRWVARRHFGCDASWIFQEWDFDRI